MININAIKEQKMEIKKLNDFFDSCMEEQSNKISVLFKSLIKDEYKSSIYVNSASISFEDGQIIVCATIINPVPTEQDNGEVYRFDISKLEFISSKEDLYDNLLSGEVAYLNM